MLNKLLIGVGKILRDQTGFDKDILCQKGVNNSGFPCLFARVSDYIYPGSAILRCLFRSPT
jgi:hypothetical protein